MSESRRREAEALQEAFDRACEEFGGHWASLSVEQTPPRPPGDDARAGQFGSLSAMGRTDRQPLVLLRLPISASGDENDESDWQVFAVYFLSGTRASEDNGRRLYEEFKRLCGLAGRLIPDSTKDDLKEYLSSYEKPTACAHFLAAVVTLNERTLVRDDFGGWQTLVFDPFVEAGPVLKYLRLALEDIKQDLGKVSQVTESGPTDHEQDCTSAAPVKFLFGWAEILDAIDKTNIKQNRDLVSRLNQTHGGPIVKGGERQPPMVDSAKFLEWWNMLEALHDEAAQHARDRTATVTESYQHGKEGEVFPNISGHGQKRRGKHRA